MPDKIKEYLHNIKDLNIHIAGISGAEGAAITKFLFKNGIKKMTLHDFSEGEEIKRSFNLAHSTLPEEEKERAFKELLSYPVSYCLGKDYLKGIEKADLIFVSQNWFNYPQNYPTLAEAKAKGIPFETIMRLYLLLFPGCKIGVTGTNGKTTTSNLIKHLLCTAGKSASLAGNDRYSLQILDRIDEFSCDDILVLEISNRQLMHLDLSPQIAVFTNITPDHLNEHKSFEDYVLTKRKLIDFQKSDDLAVINLDDPWISGFSKYAKGKISGYSQKPHLLTTGSYLKENKIFIRTKDNEISLCKVEELKIPGEHNIQNALAAVAGVIPFNLNAEKLIEGLISFKGVKNRIEFVRTVGGINFYNDLSSTNPQATLAALKAFQGRIILIMGGNDKDMDYLPLINYIKNRNLTENNIIPIILPGTASEKLKGFWQNDQFYQAKDLKEAVDLAYQIAVDGDTVLLSPAGANFFSMYADPARGFRSFNLLVKKLRKKTSK